jgi:hypothetical protein
MALSTLQTVALAGMTLGTGALVYTGVKRAQAKKALPPACDEGLTARLVDGKWQCLPVTAFEACLEGVFVHDRIPLPASIEATLSENAKKTAAQFYGFHLRGP